MFPITNKINVKNYINDRTENVMYFPWPELTISQGFIKYLIWLLWLLLLYKEHNKNPKTMLPVRGVPPSPS